MLIFRGKKNLTLGAGTWERRKRCVEDLLLSFLMGEHWSWKLLTWLGCCNIGAAPDKHHCHYSRMGAGDPWRRDPQILGHGEGNYILPTKCCKKISKAFLFRNLFTVDFKRSPSLQVCENKAPFFLPQNHFAISSGAWNTHNLGTQVLHVWTDSDYHHSKRSEVLWGAHKPISPTPSILHHKETLPTVLWRTEASLLFYFILKWGLILSVKTSGTLLFHVPSRSRTSLLEGATGRFEGIFSFATQPSQSVLTHSRFASTTTLNTLSS